MVIVHSPISCTSAGQGNEARETVWSCSKERGEGRWILPDGEGASPNSERSELDSASLHYLLMANLPEMVKPVIGREEMNASTCRVNRGDWRERVPKECPWHPGDPSRSWTLVVSGRQGAWGNHNPRYPRRRKSDRPVVVMTRGNARRAKGPFRYRGFIMKGGSA